MSVLAVSALVALAALTPASATEMKKKMKKPMAAPVAHSRIDDIYGNRTRDDFLVGPAVDAGSDNRYFSDTRYPHYLVGPGFYQRYEDHIGYN